MKNIRSKPSPVLSSFKTRISLKMRLTIYQA